MAAIILYLHRLSVDYCRPSYFCQSFFLLEEGGAGTGLVGGGDDKSFLWRRMPDMLFKLLN